MSKESIDRNTGAQKGCSKMLLEESLTLNTTVGALLRSVLKSASQASKQDLDASASLLLNSTSRTLSMHHPHS